MLSELYCITTHSTLNLLAKISLLFLKSTNNSLHKYIVLIMQAKFYKYFQNFPCLFYFMLWYSAMN